MAATFSRSPNINTRPVGQPLIYTISDSPTPDRYVVEVFRSTNRNSIGGTQTKLYLTPGAGNVSHFDLSSIAESILEYPVAKDSVPIHAVQVTDKIFSADGINIARFTVRPGTYTGTTETMNSGGDETVFCIKGVEQLSAGLDPDFSTYYAASPTRKVWLTDREPVDNVITVKMRDGEQGVAMFLNNDLLGGAGTDIAALACDLYVPSGFVQTDTISDPAGSDPAKDYYRAVPIGPGHWSHLGFASTITRVDFYFVDSSSNQLSTKLSIIKEDAICKHESAQLGWFNTRGGYDYLTFTGRAPKTITTSSKSFRKSALRFDVSTFRIDEGREDVQYSKTGRKRYTLQEQFFTAEDRDLLQYLMQSRVVSVRVGDGNWEPVNVVQDSLRIEPSGSRLYKVSLDVEVATDIRC